MKAFIHHTLKTGMLLLATTLTTQADEATAGDVFMGMDMETRACIGIFQNKLDRLRQAVEAHLPEACHRQADEQARNRAQAMNRALQGWHKELRTSQKPEDRHMALYLQRVHPTVIEQRVSVQALQTLPTGLLALQAKHCVYSSDCDAGPLLAVLQKRAPNWYYTGLLRLAALPEGADPLPVLQQLAESHEVHAPAALDDIVSLQHRLLQKQVELDPSYQARLVEMELGLFISTGTLPMSALQSHCDVQQQLSESQARACLQALQPVIDSQRAYDLDRAIAYAFSEPLYRMLGETARADTMLTAREAMKPAATTPLYLDLLQMTACQDERAMQLLHDYAHQLFRNGDRQAADWFKSQSMSASAVTDKLERLAADRQRLLQAMQMCASHPAEQAQAMRLP